MNQNTHSLAQSPGCESNPAKAGSQSGAFASAFRQRMPVRRREAGFVSTLISIRLLPLTGRYRSMRISFLREQHGSSLVEMCVLLPVLVLLLVGTVDYGRGFYTGIEVSSAAESAAIYGTSNPTDNAGITSMAQLDAKDITLNVNATYGCECSDGTGQVVSCATSLVCSNNVVRYVDVSTSTNYTPMLPYPLIPSSFTLTGHSRMRMSN